MAQNLLSAGGSWEFLAGSGLLGFEGFGASGIWGLGFRSLILGSGCLSPVANLNSDFRPWSMDVKPAKQGCSPQRSGGVEGSGDIRVSRRICVNMNKDRERERASERERGFCGV